MSGLKHDLGKTRYELLPPEFLEGVAVILTFGAQKYSDRNWEDGIAWGRAYGALQRHLWAWWQGEDNDQETGKSHLWHAGCELAFLMAFEARGMTQFDDRPNSNVRLNGGEAGDDVQAGGGTPSPAAAAPREDEQPLPWRDSRQLVQRADVRPVGGVEVANPPPPFCHDPTCPICQADRLAQHSQDGGPSGRSGNGGW